MTNWKTSIYPHNKDRYEVHANLGMMKWATWIFTDDNEAQTFRLMLSELSKKEILEKIINKELLPDFSQIKI